MDCVQVEVGQKSQGRGNFDATSDIDLVCLFAGGTVRVSKLPCVACKRHFNSRILITMPTHSASLTPVSHFG